MTAAFQKALDLYPAPEAAWKSSQIENTAANEAQRKKTAHQVLLRHSLLCDDWPLMVFAFRTVMHLDLPAAPTLLSAVDKQLHAALLSEELSEFAQSETIEDACDGLLDIIYVALGALLHMGIKPHDILAGFAEVHQSNMTKVQDNGTPLINDGEMDRTRPIGKVLKTHNYTAPDLVTAMSLPQQ